MESNKICSKTDKVLEYKSMCVIAESEEDARKQLARPKQDIDGFLSKDWELVKVEDLGPDWN